jgi:hypothetical protein
MSYNPLFLKLLKTFVDHLYNDDLAPLIIVILKGMLESLRYIQANCLEEEKADSDYKHQGDNGKSNLRLVPRSF